MPHDLVLKGGTVVDGTGAARKTADIAISGGRITEIGKLDAPRATRTLDVSGQVVAPGMIDIHTHYDAQVCWDPVLSGSAEHGVTTVVQGNCGIGIAPCRPEDRDTSLNDLVALEGIPFADMKAGIDWRFESFPEYLEMLRKRGVGINVIPLAPLSVFRRYVLGNEASDRAATDDERSRINANLREAMQAGAGGFSSTTVRRQFAGDGRPLPCSLADKAELTAYANTLRDLGRGTIQVNVVDSVTKPKDEELAVIDLLLRESGRPIAYSFAGYRDDDPEALERMLEKVEPLRQRGAYPQTTIRPATGEMSFRSPMLFADRESFRLLVGKSKEEQTKIYADPAWRAKALAEVNLPGKNFASWPNATVLRANKPALQALIGQSIADVATQRGSAPFDTMIDLALEDDLELKLLAELLNTNQNKLGEHIKDPRVLIGLHDSGAHVDMLFEASFATYMLGHWVREEKVITLEHAIRRMTSESADFFGLSDRGRIQPGKRADLMIFDPDRVGSPRRPDQMRHDLPAGGMRYYAGATGVSYVIVDGETLYDHGSHTGVLPGQVGMLP